ncbi:MAG: restriction endonuclease subunit S [Anaerovoracaceae bacterium]
MRVSNWREVRLGDLVTFQRGHDLPRKEMKDGPYPVVGSNGIIGYHSEYTTDAPCITIGRSGNVGNPFLLKCKTWAHNTTLYVKEFKNTDPIFIYYLLKTLDLGHYAGGSAVPTLNRNHIHPILVSAPESIKEQHSIAVTLSVLDDMIELNNQINKTLEEMAQAIFKSWFVDFEPFKDEEFEESEIGPIPKGWKVGMLGDFVEIVDNRGKTPPLSDVKTEYPIIDVRALSGESRVIDYSNCTKYVEKEIYDSWFRSGHPKHLDILISTVGSIAEMKMFYGNKGCIAQNVVAFRSNGISPCYLYQYLQYSKGDLLSYNIGSVQPSIKVTHVIKYKIIVPDEKTMSSFDMLMESISDQIHRNANESQILIAIRDTLLPKLISGEIRVPVEEVV